MIDAAHYHVNGHGSKGSDDEALALCRHHHDEADGKLSTAITTKEQFQAKYKFDWLKEAAALYEAYLKEGHPNG